MYFCVLMCRYGYRYPLRPQEGIRIPGAGVTGGDELPNMDATKHRSSAQRNPKMHRTKT